MLKKIVKIISVIFCYNAVNLDMGDYGYGWISKSKHTRWAKYNQDKQTSWIVCDKP